MVFGAWRHSSSTRATSSRGTSSRPPNVRLTFTRPVPGASVRWPGFTIVQSSPLRLSASSASRLASRYGCIASDAPSTSWVPIEETIT